MLQQIETIILTIFVFLKRYSFAKVLNFTYFSTFLQKGRYINVLSQETFLDRWQYDGIQYVTLS